MLLKELITIPEGVYQGDFVLKLTEGVGRAEETLHTYVITPELAKCFDQALGLIQSAVLSNSSKATFLHGSFGSGKSHFMAILHLILQGNTAARSLPELAAVIHKHNPWLAGKKFLLVPYHMIGVADLESGILGQYVSHIHKLHPDAPPAAVSQIGPLLVNARRERDAYGDEAFFKRLNEKAPKGSGAGGWGRIGAAGPQAGHYTPESFEKAAQSPPGSKEHSALVTRLLETIAVGQVDSMARRQGQYVNLDVGLTEMSKHAQALGYDAIILFLDELILWLASRAADHAFVHEQASKLTNLVEGQSAVRPIPLISFVARQRDLRELVGNQVPGAERLSFSQSLDWQQGRFSTITLEDRNLPAIVEKRILAPRDEAARVQLDQAFAQAQRQLRPNEKDILITQDFDLEAFRKVYPFSPALIESLVAVSSVLQRERTALRVLMQLLVHQRETLELGQIIPVGDLLDEVVDDTITALMPQMARHFENARKLYTSRILPMLEQSHGIKRDDALKLPHGDPKRNAFVGDDRLIKTLLLSALVPEVHALKELTAERLVALNFGTIKVPIRGRETQQALAKVREWAAKVGEIRVGEGTNPKISVRISGVDTQSILDQVQAEDNHGNRLRLVRQLLIDQLNVRQPSEQETDFPFLYRRTARVASLLFRNIRELPPSSLDNAQDEWKVIIDFPFDEQGHTPDEDIRVLRDFRGQRPRGAKTLCWMPSFLGDAALEDLGTLVKLRNIFSTADRFGSLAGHLSPQDRASAQEQLQSQRSMLENRVKFHLEAAYGLGKAEPGVLNSLATLEPADMFVSLSPGFDLKVPNAANLSGALLSLLTQAMEHEFPGAPEFQTDIKPTVWKKVWELIQPATQRPDGRQPIEKSDRRILVDVANPLKLGEMSLDSNVFVLSDHWKSKFERKINPSGAVSVGDLRTWIDEPKPMGLDTLGQNLIIRLFADQTNRVLMRHGTPLDEEGISNLPDDCVLQSFPMPTPELWDKARQRAGAIFGLATDRQIAGLTARAVKLLREELKKTVQGPILQSLREYSQQLLAKWSDLTGQKPGAGAHLPARLQTAQATWKLCHELDSAPVEEALEVLGRAAIATSETSMGTCFRFAGKWVTALGMTGWALIGSASKLDDLRRERGRQIREQAQEALEKDEHVLPLEITLQAAQAAALNLLTLAQPPLPLPRPEPITPPDLTPPPPGDPSAVSVVVPPRDTPRPSGPTRGRKENLAPDNVANFVESLKQQVRPGQTLRLILEWEIQGAGE